MHDPITRRRWLQGMAAALAASGCDQLDVDVQPQPGGFATADGIAPITPNEGFYEYQYGVRPAFDVDSWSCQIRVDGETLTTLTPQTFATLQAVEIEHTLQCIGGNPRNTLISNAVWGGLPFVEVLAQLGVVLPDGLQEIVFRAVDEYHTSIPVTDLDEEKLWLVWEMNGEPLPFEHGAPCRFLCQGRYGTKNVKWPILIEFIEGTYSGYWESTGWSSEAIYQPNAFIFQPQEGTSHVGEVVIFGTAHAGEDPVESVEISYDEGLSWEPVELTYSPGANRWTLWRTTYDGPPGRVVARTRVTTASGAQSVGPEGTNQSYGYDGGMQVVFTVST